MNVSSSAFGQGHWIPIQYTCQGDDLSPPLRWEGAPPTTKTFALICDDPDAPAGTWVHWVLYNLPASVTSLEANVEKEGQLPNGGRQGINSFDRVGYGGPCPPAGKAHRYYFKLYALDAALAPGNDPSKSDILRAMEGHIVAKGELMGLYKRQ